MQWRHVAKGLFAPQEFYQPQTLVTRQLNGHLEKSSAGVRAKGCVTRHFFAISADFATIWLRLTTLGRSFKIWGFH
jgi:hypothetical protein